MIWRIFNFSVFIGVLFFVLKKPARDFWATRAHQIRFEVEEAERLRREASVRHDQLRNRLSRLESEIGNLIRSMQEEGELERKRLIGQAEKLAIRVREDSTRIIAQEGLKAKEILKEQASELALDLAEGLIRKNFRGDDQERLSAKYLSGLEREIG